MNDSPQIAPIPKLYRQRNKEGKEIGNWFIKIAKKPINLQSQDYFEARKRAKLAVEGKRDFPDDRFSSSPETTERAPPIPRTPENTPGGDWTSDATRAASAGLTPDAYFPPGLPPMPDAAQSGGASTSSPFDEPPKPAEKAGIGDESTTLPPEMREGLVKQIAATIVELQIHGQEYLAIRWGKFQPGAVSSTSTARELPAKIWEEQVKKWIPSDVPLPAWIVAPVLTAMLTIPIQLEGATPLRKPDAPA